MVYKACNNKALFLHDSYYDVGSQHKNVPCFALIMAYWKLKMFPDESVSKL